MKQVSVRRRERPCLSRLLTPRILRTAEAAAIYASKQSMARGDVYLVCDAGGGTTDISVLKVETANRGLVELTPLTWVEGESVGSTLIDFKMKTIVKVRTAVITKWTVTDDALEPSREDPWLC